MVPPKVNQIQISAFVIMFFPRNRRDFHPEQTGEKIKDAFCYLEKFFVTWKYFYFFLVLQNGATVYVLL